MTLEELNAELTAPLPADPGDRLNTLRLRSLLAQTVGERDTALRECGHLRGVLNAEYAAQGLLTAAAAGTVTDVADTGDLTSGETNR